MRRSDERSDHSLAMDVLLPFEPCHHLNDCHQPNNQFAISVCSGQCVAPDSAVGGFGICGPSYESSTSATTHHRLLKCSAALTDVIDGISLRENYNVVVAADCFREGLGLELFPQSLFSPVTQASGGGQQRAPSADRAPFCLLALALWPVPASSVQRQLSKAISAPVSLLVTLP